MGPMEAQPSDEIFVFRAVRHLLFCGNVWAVTEETVSCSLVFVFSTVGCTEGLQVVGPNGRL